MAYEPAPLISRESPRSRRSRRRRQQQSSCACCLVVLASLVLVIIAWRSHIFSLLHTRRSPETATAAGFPLQLGTDFPSYLRYDLVRLGAVLVDARGQKVTAAKAPEVVVTREGEVVTTVGDVDRVPLRFDRNSQTYRAWWPVPWNGMPGEYIAEVWVAMPDAGQWVWETPQQRKARQREGRRNEKQPSELKITGQSYCVASARFVIQARPPADIPKGTCIATWENDFKATGINKPTGGTGDWHAMLDWCEYMGADTFWFRGAVTEVYRGSLTATQPFNPANLEAIPQMAAAAHSRGLRFGAWAAAYATYPTRASSNSRKPPYQFAQDISRSTGARSALDFISLLDTSRVDHLASFARRMQADPNVDYVGLDYLRSDKGGYEMVDQFTREMPLKLPAGFFSWTWQKRWSYVANKREREWQTDPDFFDAWNWWRAHTGARIVRSIIGKAELKKPLWVFMLSWWHGKQHGQDPIMFTDAGVSLLCPMLYQVPNRGHFNRMVRDWGGYVGPGQVNLAPGDQVDFYWHQKMLRPVAAPEELYDRIMTAHLGYTQNDKTLGAFWHDISRAADWGDKGPYPGTEWALAGGAAFSAIRTNWRVYPLTVALKAPSGAPLGSPFEVKVDLQNVVKPEVKWIRASLATTEGVEAAGEAQQTVSGLKGGWAQTIPFSVKLKGPNGARANRFMVAFFITWAAGDYGDTVRADLPRKLILMQYVQGR